MYNIIYTQADRNYIDDLRDFLRGDYIKFVLKNLIQAFAHARNTFKVF